MTGKMRGEKTTKEETRKGNKIRGNKRLRKELM